ncbi:MAG: ORF6N domain-containing protein [Bacteroidetes bacterium]|nr:ORF6N domain-containing protein [Bacteroidota bacterium]
MNKSIILREENIANFIYIIRGEKVMLDVDLANLYGIETRVLKQAVRRNLKRFPDDFMFTLTEEEIGWVVSQNVIPSRSLFGGAKPFAFTEQGVAMLSSVVNNNKAIQVNIAIMRTFVQFRKMLGTHKELALKLEQLEQKYDEQFKIVFTAIKQLISQEKNPIKKIGYKYCDKDSE